MLDQKIARLEEKKLHLEQMKEQAAVKISSPPVPEPLDVAIQDGVEADMNSAPESAELRNTQCENIPVTFSQEQLIDMIEALTVLYGERKTVKEMDEQESLDREVLGAGDGVIVIYEQGNGMLKKIFSFILLIIVLVLIGAALLFVSEYMVGL